MEKQSVIVVLALFLPLFSMALEQDKEAPIHIRAREGEIQKKTGVIRLSGNVSLKQGSTEIQANEVTIETSAKDEITYAKAQGSPTQQAHYQTALDQAAKQTTWLRADADTLEWFPKKQQIILTGKASVQHESQIVTAPKIVYTIQTQHAQTSSDKTGAQTVFTLHPLKQAKVNP